MMHVSWVLCKAMTIYFTISENNEKREMSVYVACIYTIITVSRASLQDVCKMFSFCLCYPEDTRPDITILVNWVKNTKLLTYLA